MEAKDTVMSAKRREDIQGTWVINPFSDQRDRWIESIILDVAQQQAEITWNMAFKAGQDDKGEECDKKLREMALSYDTIIKTTEFLVRRKVVEWVEKLQDTFVDETCVGSMEWQAYKKEKGID